MIVVVSDTSPIRALANLGILEVLQALYQEIIVPPAVQAELHDPPVGQAVVDLAAFSFIKIRLPADASKVGRLLEGLDRGETEALALALELHADLVLIDEADGRARAKQAGLATIGVLGILLEAKHRGFIGPLGPMLDQLRDEYRFFIAPRLRDAVLRSAGEQP